MNHPDTLLVRNLRALKQDSGKSWGEIARELDIHKRSLFFWLSGRHEPSLESLRRVADYFGVSLDYFEREHP